MKLEKVGFLKAGFRLLYWVFFQAPEKFDEMTDYCAKQLKGKIR